MTEIENVQAQIASNETRIAQMTEQLESFHRVKESLEHRLKNLRLEEAGKLPITMLAPKGMPKVDDPVWVTCRSCHRKTRDRVKTGSGLEVARCSNCALEDVAAELFGDSDRSAHEANEVTL